jgi:hypothetical protein
VLGMLITDSSGEGGRGTGSSTTLIDGTSEAVRERGKREERGAKGGICSCVFSSP